MNPKLDSQKLTAARALWNEYDALKGTARTEFRHANLAALTAAADLVTAAETATPEPVIDEAKLTAARSFLAKYEGMSGGARSTFFRENETELFAAARVIDAAEGKPAAA